VSVRLVTDATGATIARSRRDYLPFGELWPASTPTHEERSFAGKERDKETSFDYSGAPYFDSHAGRFTSADPVTGNVLKIVNPQRWNRYSYAL
jgi:RHS repeat-associated protein